MRNPAHGTRHAARRGFTLMELLVVLLVIFMLMGLLLGGIHLVHGRVRGVADRATVQSLKNAVTHFRTEFSFSPPLIKDRGNPTNNTGPFTFDGMGPLATVGGVLTPQVYSLSGADLDVLRGGVDQNEPGTYSVYSEYSLPYYVLGIVETRRVASDPNSVPVDGFAGPGFRAVKRNGSFEASGKVIQALFDVSRNAKAVYQIDAAAGKIVLRDKQDVPFRYYRWEHDDGQPIAGHPSVNLAIGRDATKIFLNVPRILYDPQFAIPFGQLASAGVISPLVPDNLKNATFAVVAAGANGVFGDELPADIQRKLGTHFDLSDVQQVAKLIGVASADNAVEAGQ